MGIFESYIYRRVYLVDLFSTSRFIDSMELSEFCHFPSPTSISVAHLAHCPWEEV